jgi:hypothetical protein
MATHDEWTAQPTAREPSGTGPASRESSREGGPARRPRAQREAGPRNGG